MTIKVLALHKRDIPNKEFLRLLYERYPTLKENRDLWKIFVTKVGEVTYKRNKQKFDRIYFDKQSTNIEEITRYIVAAHHPQVIEIDFNHERVANKLKTFVVSKGVSKNEAK